MNSVTESDAPGTLEKESPPHSSTGEIQCPKCHWKPGDQDRWACTCGHSWNTFETHGCCPQCGKRWLDTQCLNCHGWSLHDAWYADDSSSFTA